MVRVGEAVWLHSAFLHGLRRQDCREGRSESLQRSWKARRIHLENAFRNGIVVGCWEICFVMPAEVGVRPFFPPSTLNASGLKL
jgi:hypothetical protein